MDQERMRSRGGRGSRIRTNARSGKTKTGEREGERQVHSNRERDGKDKGRSGVWLEELVLLSPPQRPSGGFPRNPAVLNKGRSNGRQRSKTCYFSSLSPNQSCNSERAAYRLIVAASLDRDREYRVHGRHQYRRREYYRQC